MIDPAKWIHAPDPVLTWPGGAMEDLVVRRGASRLCAYFCAGQSLQQQKLYTARLDTPFGPLYDIMQLSDPEALHTRLYRGRVDEHRRVITAVWPGLPKAGLWLFEERHFGMLKTLLVSPRDSTLFSIAVANPCVVFDGIEWNIYFEGRANEVFWRIFQTTWDGHGGLIPPRVTTYDSPLWDGANPSILVHDDVVYLYYSKWVGAGFETRVAYQPVPSARSPL